MKLLLALCVAAALCPAYGMEAVAKGDGGTVLRLSKRKCVDAGILDSLNPEHADEFMQAEARLNDKVLTACWVLADDDNVFIVFSNGKSMAMPTSAFRTEPGV